MKKYLLPLFLFFFLPYLAWSELGYISGAGLNLNLSGTFFMNTSEAGNTEKAGEIDLVFQPSAHFMLDDVTEFVPYLTFGSHWEEDGSNLRYEIKDDVYQPSIGAGLSLLWHFWETDQIHLLTGLRGDFLFGLNEMGDGAATGDSGDPKSFTFAANFFVPLAMDFLLTQDFSLRLSTDLIKMGATYERYKDEDGIQSVNFLESSFPFLSDADMSLISLAVIYWLGNSDDQ